MVVALPTRLARSYRDSFSGENGLAWASVGKAAEQLHESAGDPSVNGTMMVAVISITTLFKSMLEDLTRAVPWDEKEILREARNSAIELARESIDILANFDPDDIEREKPTIIKLAEIQKRYIILLEQINSSDRAMLASNAGRKEDTNE